MVCGKNKDGSCLTSIERLHILNRQGLRAWTLIQIPDHVLEPRSHCLVAPLNEEELVIMGGSFDDEDILASVVLVNTLTLAAEKVVGDHEDYRFHSGNNNAQ